MEVVQKNRGVILAWLGWGWGAVSHYGFFFYQGLHSNSWAKLDFGSGLIVQLGFIALVQEPAWTSYRDSKVLRIKHIQNKHPKQTTMLVFLYA